MKRLPLAPRKEVVFLQQTYPDKYRGEELEGAPGTFRFTGREMDARAFEASHSQCKAIWELPWVADDVGAACVGGGRWGGPESITIPAETSCALETQTSCALAKATAV